MDRMKRFDRQFVVLLLHFDDNKSILKLHCVYSPGLVECLRFQFGLAMRSQINSIAAENKNKLNTKKEQKSEKRAKK